jgi:hypothetical protein
MIFINNKYTAIYFRIIDRAKIRNSIVGYTENHHIIPRSLGGSDGNDNLVRLSAREHFICHWLLIKMIDGDSAYKMVKAFSMMRTSNSLQKRYSTKITSRIFDNIRSEISLANSVSGKAFNSTLSPEERKHRHGRIGTQNGFFGKNHPEWLAEQIKESHLLQRLDKTECEKCGILCDAQNYKKHHGVNCGTGAKGIRGKRWFNNGTETYYLFPDNPDINLLNLIPGRVGAKLGRPKRSI